MIVLNVYNNMYLLANDYHCYSTLYYLCWKQVHSLRLTTSFEIVRNLKLKIICIIKTIIGTIYNYLIKTK